MILNEDLFDIPTDIVITDDVIVPEEKIKPEGPSNNVDNGLANQIITQINGEWTTIADYNNLIVALRQYNREDFVGVIQDIIREENVHVGQLQAILKVISPNVSEIQTGEQEAEEQVPQDGLDESLNEADLHPKFKRDIKDKYKQWDYARTENERKRAELRDLLTDKKEPLSDKHKKLIDKVYPQIPKFKYQKRQDIEYNNYPYYVSFYAEYPIYEPAEGGYYYSGNNATYSKGFDSESQARKFMDDYVHSAILDGENWHKYGKDGYFIPSKYVGEQHYIMLEPNKAYLSDERGYEPYS